MLVPSSSYSRRTQKWLLEIISDLKRLKKFDKLGATAALQKLQKHLLWYLISETLVPLSIFDFRVSDEDNRLFVRNLKKNVGVPDPPRSLQGPIEACTELSSLFTTNSSEFFKMLNIPLDFLDWSHSVARQCWLPKCP